VKGLQRTEQKVTPTSILEEWQAEKKIPALLVDISSISFMLTLFILFFSFSGRKR
jgi:hypothetical protein